MTASKSAVALAFLRVVVAAVFITHGWPKLFEGGVHGLAQMLDGRGFPVAIAWAWFVTLLETVGGLLLALGLFTRPLALLFAVEMAVAIILVHWPNGWYVSEGGMEFNVLLIAASLVLAFVGPGAWALERRSRTASS
jgi:putative oxidoreductase